MSQTATITRPETAFSLNGKDSPSSATNVDGIELQRLGSKGQRVGSGSDDNGETRRNSSEEDGAVTADQPLPGQATHGELQRWNHPKGNVPRLAFAFLSFVIAGMNDAAIGVSTPGPI